MKNNNNSFANNPYINGGSSNFAGGGFNGNFGAGFSNAGANANPGFGNSGFGNPYANGGFNGNFGAGFSNGAGFGFNSGFGSSAGSNFAGINTGDLLKGALIGAAAAYILSNEDLQKKLFKTLASLSEIVGSTIEEMKERYEDMKAEVQVQNQ